MAIYHLHIKTISRSDGRSATGAAAYRAGERIRDERTGVVHNHARRVDVSHREIVLPSSLDAGESQWAKDRASLWNTAERSESRRNARVAREYEVSLPAELTAPQRINLARAFAQELSDRHRTAIDLAIHEPRPRGDARNFHAHLLETTREINEGGLGAKAGLDMSSRARQQLGLPSALVEFNAVRERWAVHVNEALHAAGFEQRVDHRSYQARGIDQEPKPHIPYAAIQAERRGLRSEIAEQLRERYRQRVRQRLELSRGSELEQRSDVDQGVDVEHEQALEQLRRRAREAWLRMRRGMTLAGGLSELNELSEANEHVRDKKDLSL